MLAKTSLILKKKSTPVMLAMAIRIKLVFLVASFYEPHT